VWRVNLALAKNFSVERERTDRREPLFVVQSAGKTNDGGLASQPESLIITLVGLPLDAPSAATTAHIARERPLLQH
jgi:hypothetical protein